MLFWRLLKIPLKPFLRLRKCKRKGTMKQLKIAIGVLGVSSCLITLFLYSWHQTPVKDTMKSKLKATRTIASSLYLHRSATPFRHVPLNEVYKNKPNDDMDSFETENKHAPMLGTPGCQIPVSMVKYNIDNNNKKRSCGRRAVFLNKNGDDVLQVTIKARIMRKYLRKSATFHCCYRFINRSNHTGAENSKIGYSKCKTLNDGATITLESDFVNVKCYEHDKRNTSHLIYNDAYGFCKKVYVPKINETKCKRDKYNILMIGMDSMSLSRLEQTMKRTINYFKDNSWLGFRGYHKVDDNTFPNFMAALAGMNISTISSQCSGKMDKCNDLLIWSKLRDIGYVTAYGEDYLRLPDTFSKDYAFIKQPTHHYMRPLFINGETEFHQSLVCAGKVPSGQQLLNFALDFAVTYRNESFFGIFWMNSFSHNVNSHPNDADRMLENFFNQLAYTGVLSNTFVIFFSDHGIRFGEYRLNIESYYEERLPILFLLVPLRFRARYPHMYKSTVINQFRLITPYDLYNSMVYIKNMATCDNTTEVSEGCPNCQNLFHTVDENRTCKDVAIHDKWCSCHKLYPLDMQDSSGVSTILYVVSLIKSKVQSIKTQRCWTCASLALLKIIRIHFYYERDAKNVHYVVAFAMTPGNTSYEATVLRNGKNLELVGPISVISRYKGIGQCTINNQQRDRLFCICQKIPNC